MFWKKAKLASVSSEDVMITGSKNNNLATAVKLKDAEYTIHDNIVEVVFDGHTDAVTEVSVGLYRRKATATKRTYKYIFLANDFNEHVNIKVCSKSDLRTPLFTKKLNIKTITDEKPVEFTVDIKTCHLKFSVRFISSETSTTQKIKELQLKNMEDFQALLLRHSPEHLMKLVELTQSYTTADDKVLKAFVSLLYYSDKAQKSEDPLYWRVLKLAIDYEVDAWNVNESIAVSDSFEARLVKKYVQTFSMPYLQQLWKINNEQAPQASPFEVLIHVQEFMISHLQTQPRFVRQCMKYIEQKVADKYKYRNHAASDATSEWIVQQALCPALLDVLETRTDMSGDDTAKNFVDAYVPPAGDFLQKINTEEDEFDYDIQSEEKCQEKMIYALFVLQQHFSKTISNVEKSNEEAEEFGIFLREMKLFVDEMGVVSI